MEQLKIISGGQTGVDRGALDAAITAGTPLGGWCPKGRRAEDGVIPDIYPLKETESEDYQERSKKNVIDSDGTLIVYYESLNGGTELTRDYCSAEAKPLLMIDANSTGIEEAEQMLFDFLRKYSIRTLNVAGPRASSRPYGHDFTYRLVSVLLRASQT